jgi:predicted RNA-binding Zn-ribbon protein involved in translation (DUF1610 family)
MPDKDFGQKQKSPCSTKTVPVPEFIACTRCGAEVELWTDEEETACPSCRQKIFKKESIIH